MTWPWVPRSLYVEAVRQRDTLAAYAEEFRAELERERRRYESLVSEVLKMQRDGFSYPHAVVDHVETAPVLDPKIEEAIQAMMNPNGEAARTVRGWAWQQVKAHVPVETIAIKILEGDG